MAKILRNTTAGSITLTDVGVTIGSGVSYTIDPTNYDEFAASSDSITNIGTGDLVVNDGSVDLSIANGTALLQGSYPQHIAIRGDTDDTLIGNTGDALNVSATITGAAQPPSAATGSLGSLNSYVEFDNSTLGLESLGMQITGTWAGTITPSISVDGTNFNNCSMFQDSNGALFTSTTANGIFNRHIGSIKKFRLTMTAYTSGTASTAYFATGARSQSNAVQIQQNTSAAGVSNQTRVPSIEQEHQKIHEGKMFHAFSDILLGSNGYQRYIFTPGSSTAHMLVNLFCNGLTDYHLYEDPTGVTTSSTITAYNRSRASATAPLATFQVVSTYSTLGTLIDDVKIGATGGNSASTQIGRSQEWDLPNGKTYLIEIHSGSSNNDITVWLDWYEG